MGRLVALIALAIVATLGLAASADAGKNPVRYRRYGKKGRMPSYGGHKNKGGYKNKGKGGSRSRITRRRPRTRLLSHSIL